MTEELLTEAQWRRREALRGCAIHGHDYENLINGANDLLAVTCQRCGRHWAVVAK